MADSRIATVVNVSLYDCENKFIQKTCNFPTDRNLEPAWTLNLNGLALIGTYTVHTLYVGSCLTSLSTKRNRWPEEVVEYVTQCH